MCAKFFEKACGYRNILSIQLVSHICKSNACFSFLLCMTYFCVCGANTCVHQPKKAPGFLFPLFGLLPVWLYCHSDVSVTAPPQTGGGSTWSDDDSEVEVVYVREPTAEQAALARELQLPPTFFCYQNEPDYISDDQTDGEIKWAETRVSKGLCLFVCFFLFF